MQELKILLDKYSEHTGKDCKECGTELVNFTLGGSELIICPTCERKNLKQKSDKEMAERGQQALYQKGWNYFHTFSVINNKGLLDSGFKNFDVSEPHSKKVKEAAVSFMKEILNGENKHLILSGKAGRGKSHLAMAIARSVIELGGTDNKVIFIHYSTYLNEVKRSFNANDDAKRKIANIEDQMKRCDLLIIDDLGVELGSIRNPEAPTRWNLDTLNLILDGREDKPLVVTTNLNQEQLSHAYDNRNFSRMFKHSKGYRIGFDKLTDKRVEA